MQNYYASIQLANEEESRRRIFDVMMLNASSKLALSLYVFTNPKKGGYYHEGYVNGKIPSK